MTGPSSTPRGERAGRPGTTWETHLTRTEVIVQDTEDTTTPLMNEPLPPRPNRATRRAMERAARRKK